MTEPATFMAGEIAEVPERVAQLLEGGAGTLDGAGRALRDADPVMVGTVARGSSDHAAGFAKYAIELTAGVPVASLGPSVASIYGRDLRLRGCAAIAISQSGRSPDIVALAESARRGGALTIGLTNTVDSPLAAACALPVDLLAGPERSVAATKSFVNSVVAGLAILAAWCEDEGLRAGLARLPETLERSLRADWSALAEALDGRHSLYVLGRGPAMAIASEAALKFKETCAVHAEAYSAAEVMHGPVRIVEPGYPILALAARDAAEASVVELVDTLAGSGARAFVTSDRATIADCLPFAADGHPLTDALTLIVSFYAFVEALARRRGFDPDRPPNLKKVTETR